VKTWDGTVRDHRVETRDFLTVWVFCPVAPNDPQQAHMGRCSTCGCSLRGRTYEKESVS
jgi:hypothetical protein